MGAYGQHQLGEFLVEARRRFLLHHLEAHGWNVTHTARAIGMQRTYLWRVIGLAGLRRPCPSVSEPVTKPGT